MEELDPRFVSFAVDVRKVRDHEFNRLFARHSSDFFNRGDGGDQGWEHDADRWDVVGPDGKVIASRKLLHPHVDEQPLTRSLSGLRIAQNIARVSVRAHVSSNGLGGKAMTLVVRHKQ